MSGDCLENGPSCVTLTFCERKGAKTGLVIIFSLFLPPQSVSLSAPFFLLLLLLFSLSPLNGCNDLSKKELLLLFNESGPPLLDSPSFLPHSLTPSTRSLSRLSLNSCSLSLVGEI